MERVPQFVGKGKSTLVLLGIAVVLGLAAFLWTRRAPLLPPRPTAPSPTPTLEAVPTLPLSPLPRQGGAVNFVITITAPPPVPQTMPVYKIEPSLSFLSLVKNAATRLGFVADSFAGESPGRYFWLNKAGAKLSAQESPPAVSFQQEIPLKPGAPSRGEAALTVQKLLKDAGLISSEFGLLPVESGFFAVSGVNVRPASQSQAHLTYVSYQYLLGGYPLYLEAKSRTDITSLVGAEGATRSFSVAIPPTIISLFPAPLLSFESALAALKNNLGVLVAVDKSGFSEVTPRASFSQATISDAFLAYAALDSGGLIKPIYVFSGRARDDRGAILKITYFVAATAR